MFSEIWSLLIAGESQSCGLVGRLFADSRGVTAIEYGLIAALIAVASVVVMGTVGTDLTATFTTVANSL